MTFELPFVRPVLNSNEDIFARCGPLKYTITITSAKLGTYEAAFTLKPTSTNQFTSANVEVYTLD